MNRKEIKQILDKITEEIDSIADKKAVAIIKLLINLVEMLAEENAKLKETIQELKDEVNRLKGERGKPNFRKQKKGDEPINPDHSSEKDRSKRGDKKKRKPKNKKTQTVRVDRQVTIEFDKSTLPGDAEFKGYESRIIQDIKIITDNVEFKLPVYYSASLNQTFIAPVPDAYKGSEFGPGLKSLVIMYYRDSGMTIPAIERFLKTFSIQISRSTISRILIEDNDHFHQEKKDIFHAGMKACNFQQIDDTGCYVNGKNYHTHIICNPFFTAYFTRKRKDRLTLLDILCRGELKYAFNEEAYELMLEFGLAKKWQKRIKSMLKTEALTRKEMDAILQQFFPNLWKQGTNKRIILESSALAYYYKSGYFIKYLMSDDAPQFNKLALHHALCIMRSASCALLGS